MARYRKKPVEIEAMRLGSHVQAVAEWAAGAISLYPEGPDGPLAVIHTREGLMYAGPDDWIIKGVRGEFYPCKSDIFEATYEPA